MLVEALDAGCKRHPRCDAVTVPSHSLDECVAWEILQFGLLDELLDQSSMAQNGRAKADKSLKASFHFKLLVSPNSSEGETLAICYAKHFDVLYHGIL